ncbi:hypothetical protein [Stenotrophomonas nematodicola]|uniref:Uncharacterized protein n=1 Tax=Stenotrophomonas nematodicola TaxID=2656746 RepID=A0ABW7D370_9GAMM
MSDRTCDCINSVIAMIPMPISHVARQYAERYCEWGLPPDAIAIGILELLIGPGRDDWDHGQVKEEHLAIAKALMEGRDGVELLKEAAESKYFSEKMGLWRDICKKINTDPKLTSKQCREVYSKVLSGKIKSVSAALDHLYGPRLRAPEDPAPGSTIKPHSPRR